MSDVDNLDYEEYLKLATEQNPAIILELNLDGTIQYISPQWLEVSQEDILPTGRNVSTIIKGEASDKNVFNDVMDLMLQNDAISYTITFTTLNGIVIEACGILILGDEKQETHSMWILKNYIENNSQQYLIDLNNEINNIDETTINLLINKLGFGITFLNDYLNQIIDYEIIDETNIPMPRLELCRVCECFVPDWWLESHCQTCIVEHRIESIIQLLHDNLLDQLNLLDSTNRNNKIPQEYKNLPLIAKSDSHLDNIIDSLIKLCHFAININTSELLLKYQQLNNNKKNNNKNNDNDNDNDNTDISTNSTTNHNNNEAFLDFIEKQNSNMDDDNNWEFEFSPNTKSNIKNVQQWENPLLENNYTDDDTDKNGLSLLIKDTIKLARDKVDAVLRLDNAMTYSLKIKNEINIAVLKLIRNQLRINLINFEHKNSIPLPQNEDNQEMPPKLASPQPSKRAILFADSYLQNDIIPDSKRTSDENSDNDNALASNNAELSNKSEGSETDTEIIIPRPISHRSSRSITPSTELDFHNEKPRLSQTPKIIEHNKPNDNSNTNNNNNNSSIGSTLFSNFTIKNLSANNLTPKPLTTVSLTPRRGSPLMQRNSGSKPPILSDKSPLNSPFIAAKEFLTPEQYPTLMNSPNQPLSPLLLATNQFKSPTPSIKDYDILKPISKGAYGSVYLTRKKLTGEYFAIKVLKKSDMIAKNQMANVKSERAIMMVQSDKPYVAKLFATFQNKDNLFLVMEYLPGGDLAALIKMMGYLPDKWVKQYICEIVISVDDMHQDGIIHHDLKPDNLLIDITGHIKLTDFGLSRAGLIKRHKTNPKGKTVSLPSEYNSSSTSTPESNHSSNMFSSRLRKISNSRQPMESIDNLQLSDAGNKLSTDAQNLKRTESQLSFSMLNVSRSSTPPPSSFPLPLGEQPLSATTSSASNTSANTVIATNHNLSTPVHQRITSIDLSDNNNNGSTTSDLALFHPDNPKQDKKFFGTPDYLAPETIKGTGEDENCDWWSVGCIFFELLFGYPPFHASTPERVFEKILSCDIQWPEFKSKEIEEEIMSPEARDFILRLLVVDPKERLGANGINDIKNHPYLKDVDWDHVYDEKASFVPVVEDPEDTDYFDPRGVKLEDFGDEVQDDARSIATIATLNTTNADNRMRGHSSSNFDMSEIHSTPTIEHISNDDKSLEKKCQGLALTTDKEGLNPLNKPINKLSISSVLEALPQDSNSSTRSSTKSIPLAIPPYMRERRSSKLSETQTEFGSFSFRNLSALDKANKDAINRLKNEHLSESPGATRRLSVSSQTGSSSENSVNKTRTGRISVTGSPAINSVARTVTKSDTSSIRSFSPDRSINLDQSISSRKGSNASTMETIPIISPLVTNLTNNSINAINTPLYFSDSESPLVNKFKSTLSPSHGNINHNPRSSLLSSTPRRSSSEVGSDAGDRASIISKVNSIGFRRRSQRKSSVLNDLGYNLDILLCEPIPIHRYRTTKDLEKLGCSVVGVGAGDELVSRATSGIKFDIILTALRLSKLGALDIAKLLRRTNGINSTTPIVAITNYYQEAVSTNVFDDVVEKPVDFEDLRRVIAKYALKKSQETEDTIFSDGEDLESLQE